MVLKSAGSFECQFVHRWAHQELEVEASYKAAAFSGDQQDHGLELYYSVCHRHLSRAQRPVSSLPTSLA